MKFNLAYYIAEHGQILEVCESFRSDIIEWRKKVFDYLTTIGAEGYQVGWAGNILSVKFKGERPEGFKVPNKHGCCEPYAKSDWRQRLAELGTQPDADDYLEPIIKAPRKIHYKSANNDGRSGGYNIGHMFSFYQICYFSETGPLLVVLPDVEKELKRFPVAHPDCVITNDVSYNLPPGLKPILAEEWDLMAAKAAQASEAAT